MTESGRAADRLPDEVPAPADFARLFATTGWETQGLDRRDGAEPGAVFDAGTRSPAYAGDRLVGMGRVIGDGLLHALIADVIVEPTFQRRGIGRAIVERLVGECQAHRILDVQLFCAPGKRGFYEHLGFTARPDDAPGMQLVPPTTSGSGHEAGANGGAAATVTFPTAAMSMTRLLVVSDLARAKAWYRDVLGAEVTGEYGGTSCVLRLLDAWLLLVTGGPPTADKPTVAFDVPDDPDRASAEIIIGVPDCRAAYEVLSGRGATFLAPPVEYPWEIRAFLRDPDGHLFEISEARRGG